MPADAPGMRAELSSVQEALASAAARPDGARREAQAAACGRLSDLLRELEDGFVRYELSKEGHRLVSLGYAKCDEAPGVAAQRLQEALTSAPRAASEPSSGG